MKAKIIGTGSYLPKRILTNQDLEKMVETSDEWIFTRTGMRERRIADDQEFTSDMGAHAGLLALKEAGLDPTEVDLILVATATPDYVCLGTACLIQAAIGAANAGAMDLQAACSGYLYGLATAKAFIESGLYRHILVIASEKLSSILNYQDRTTCVLFGDGAAAALVSASKKPGLRIDSLNLGAAGEHALLGMVPAGGSREPASEKSVAEKRHTIHMVGSEIFKHAVRKMEQACLACLNAVGVKEEEIDWLIPHQANMRIIEALAKRFNKPLERIFINIDKYGNTSASSIAIALDELRHQHPLQKGSKILLTAFGFGLTWGAILLTYEE